MKVFFDSCIQSWQHEITDPCARILKFWDGCVQKFDLLVLNRPLFAVPVRSSISPPREFALKVSFICTFFNKSWSAAVLTPGTTGQLSSNSIMSLKVSIAAVTLWAVVSKFSFLAPSYCALFPEEKLTWIFLAGHFFTPG